MTLSIHASADHIVKNVTRKDARSEIVENPGQFHAICQWRKICDGGTFYGSTRKVVQEYYGDHSYNARITSSIEKNIISSNDMYQKRFTFHTRQMSGQRVDIPRYLSGDQRYWFSMKRVHVKRKCVRVYAPMGGLGNITRNDMSVCGALTCAAVEILESNGIGVELWASCVSSNVAKENPEIQASDEKWPDAVATFIKIKDVNQYCDYGMIDYVTGDSHFYRNIVFKDRILTTVKRGLYFKGLGASDSISRDQIPNDEGYDSSVDILIPRIYNIATAKSWLEGEEFLGQLSNEKEA